MDDRWMIEDDELSTMIDVFVYHHLKYSYVTYTGSQYVFPHRECEFASPSFVFHHHVIVQNVRLKLTSNVNLYLRRSAPLMMNHWQ